MVIPVQHDNDQDDARRPADLLPTVETTQSLDDVNYTATTIYSNTTDIVTTSLPRVLIDVVDSLVNIITDQFQRFLRELFTRWITYLLGSSTIGGFLVGVLCCIRNRYMKRRKRRSDDHLSDNEEDSDTALNRTNRSLQDNRATSTSANVHHRHTTTATHDVNSNVNKSTDPWYAFQLETPRVPPLDPHYVGSDDPAIIEMMRQRSYSASSPIDLAAFGKLKLDEGAVGGKTDSPV